MAASVKVAVRVRPFNEREINMNSSCIVEVQENKTRLLCSKLNHNEIADAKEFTFDYSYWSHNTDSHHFASQEKVYNDLGSSVVSSGLHGYNACVFAYGQTGSGKTYTMMGSQNNPGLIPRICKALFSSMEKGTESGVTYKVEVSYLEIYNERVKDLLSPRNANMKEASLKVREHFKHGPYVENLSKHIVTQYSEVQELMHKGNSYRTTASTNMNDTSSRSHAIFTLTFVQARLQADVPLETRSKINLVDLAGSERADATGATGQRLKEGSHINKSLVTLGTVISALAEQGAKTVKKSHIPYRDSVLTFLLKDSLGGNSKTIMIATISPADVNFGETLGTLRYANRAKNIINKPTVNEDANVKLIRELRSEIMMLRNMIGADQSTNVDEQGESADVSIRATLSLKEAQEKELTDMWTEKWRQTQRILQEQHTLELRKAGESGRGVVLDSERPHLVLYDDDLGSTGLILYHLNDEVTTLGASQDQDIRLEGPGVERAHCVIRLHGQKATLQRISDGEVFVNDQIVKESSSLSHGAMIVVGTSHIFRYNDPQEAARIRKQGNRSSVNLSRLSFLSRSNTDLFKAPDILQDVVNDQSESKVVFENQPNSQKVESNAEVCEMSTQTSLPHLSDSHSTPQIVKGTIESGHLEESEATNLFDKNNLEDLGTPIDTPYVHEDTTPVSNETFFSAKSDLSFIADSGPTSHFIGLDLDVNAIGSPIKGAAMVRLNSPGACHGAATSTPKNCIGKGDINAGQYPDKNVEFSNGQNDIAPGILVKSEFSRNFRRNLSASSQFAEVVSERDLEETPQVVDLQRQNFDSNLEKSELLSLDCGITTMNEALFKICGRDGANASADQQHKELKELQNYYTAMEHKLLEARKGAKESSTINDAESSALQDLQHVDDLLREERVVLLIEKEVQRRLQVEMSNLEKRCSVLGCGKELPGTSDVHRSSSSCSYKSNPRTLSPLDIRPFYSLSDLGFAAPNTAVTSGLIYFNKDTEDDLLLSPVPLDTVNGSQNVSIIDISVPFFELKDQGARSAHCVYQINISVGSESWIIKRRYRRFRELHLSMSKKYGPVIQDLYFPPRRIFGNYSLGVVQRRRTELEAYLRQLISLSSEMQGSPLCDVPPKKSLLEELSSFFSSEILE